MAQSSNRFRLTDLPEFNVFVFAVLLNYPWELMQVPLYRGMSDAAHWDAIKICTRAALGDGVIMLLAYWGAVLLVPVLKIGLAPLLQWLILPLLLVWFVTRQLAGARTHDS